MMYATGMLLCKFLFNDFNIIIVTLHSHVSEIQSHYFSSSNASVKMADKGRNMQEGYRMIVYYCM